MGKAIILLKKVCRIVLSISFFVLVSFSLTSAAPLNHCSPEVGGGYIWETDLYGNGPMWIWYWDLFCCATYPNYLKDPAYQRVDVSEPTEPRVPWHGHLNPLYTLYFIKTTDLVETCEGCSRNSTGMGSSANLGSGNLYHSQDILSIPQGVSLSFAYNSIDLYNGPLGRGWTHSYNVMLYVRDSSFDSSILYLVKEDGKRVFFKRNGGVYYPLAGSGEQSTIVKNPDGTYTQTLKDGRIFTFDSSGKLVSLKDRNGNTTSLTYSGGNLMSITDPSGRTTLFSTNSGKITSITSPDGRTSELTYNGSFLSSIKDPAGNSWQFTYDSGGRMLTKTDSRGNKTSYTYDYTGKVVASTDPGGKTKGISYSQTTNTAVVTEKDGSVWTYKYDPKLNVPLEMTDPQGNKTTNTYDNKGNLLTLTEPGGGTTTYIYDTLSNMTSVTDSAGNITTYIYNNFGQVMGITDPQGKQTLYVYNANGNLTTMTDPSGATTQYQYDTKGNVTSITNAAGQKTTFTYDQYSNLASMTDAAGAATTYSYNTSGNMISQTDPSGNTIIFEYSSLNQLTRVVDQTGNISSYTYDAKGNRISSTDVNGNVIRYEYNYNDQLTKVIDALGGTTTYTYGAMGCPACGGGDKLTSITDAGENTTSYQYDTLGRLTKETDPSGKAITYTYDASGNLISKKDAMGITITYTYDVLKRLTSIQYPDTTQNITYTYDALGKVLTMTDQSGTTSYSYDSSNRLLSETRQIDGMSYTTSYSYTVTGGFSSITYPSGRTVTYAQDTAGKVINVAEIKDSVTGSVITNITYSPNGSVSAITAANGIVSSKTYDSKNTLSGMNIGNLKQFSYSRDNVGNITSITDLIDPTKTKTYSYDAIYRLTRAIGPWGTIQYSYDPVGNRTTETTGAGTAHYAYSANRLLSSTGVKSFTFGYDSNGNTVTENQRQYIYNQNQRLIKAVEGTKTLGEYVYNGNSQRTKKTVNGKTTYFIYDQSGNLIEEADGDGKSLSDYIYLGSTPIARADMSTVTDTVAPVTSISMGAPSYNGYISAATPMPLSATDDGNPASGVDYSEYKIDDAAFWTRYTGSINIGTYSDGAHTFYYRSVDKAGNVEDAKSMKIYLDATPPVSSINIGNPNYQAGGKLYMGSGTTITIAATDSGSGVRKTEYSIDGGPYTLYSGPFTLALYIEGQHTIRYRSVDNVSNVESEKTLTVILDRTPPMTAITASAPLMPGVTNTVSPNTTFSLSSTDDLSGIGTIQFLIDNTGWSTYASGFSLPPVAGSHTIGYKAKDNLGNEEAAKSLTVKMIVLDVSKEILLEPIVLAGVLGSTPLTQSALNNLTSILSSSGLSFYIPQTDEKFKETLREGRYNTYLLVDFNEQGLNDEVREAVNYGDGLVFIKTLPDTIPSLQDVFGVKFNGMSTNGNLTVNLTASPISAAMTFQSKGKAVRTAITSTSAASLGNVTDKKDAYPLIVSNQYGRGKVVLFGFDLLNSPDQNKVSSLIVSSINYVAPTERHTHALGDEPISINIKNSTEPVDIKVTETLPENTVADSFSPSGTQSDNTITWQLSLGANEKKKLGYWLLLPDMGGNYQVTTELRYKNQWNYRLYGNYSLILDMAINAADLLSAIVSDLRALQISGGDADHIASALSYLTSITDHQGITKAEVQTNISYILSALKELGKVSVDVSAIRLKLDELLKIWQTKWTLAAEAVSWTERYKLTYETDARNMEKKDIYLSESPCPSFPSRNNGIGGNPGNLCKKPILIASAGPLSGLLNQTSSTDVLYFYHTDHLGTSILMTDSSGNKVWEGEFLPFGEAYSITGTVTNNLRFPGQYYDEETGLHQNWHRDYNPEIGRYVEADPIGIQQGKNHLYVYVGNNPVNRKDPTGLAWYRYGNWCGPGGSGTPTNCYDSACKRHDKCYEDCGIDALSRWYPSNITSGCAAQCDKTLANDWKKCACSHGASGSW